MGKEKIVFTLLDRLNTGDKNISSEEFDMENTEFTALCKFLDREDYIRDVDVILI